MRHRAVLALVHAVNSDRRLPAKVPPTSRRESPLRRQARPDPCASQRPRSAVPRNVLRLPNLRQGRRNNRTTCCHRVRTPDRIRRQVLQKMLVGRRLRTALLRMDELVASCLHHRHHSRGPLLDRMDGQTPTQNEDSPDPTHQARFPYPHPRQAVSGKKSSAKSSGRCRPPARVATTPTGSSQTT